jgi:hypothetical protein
MERAVEKKWDYRGLQCIVTRADIGCKDGWSQHRCGYVRIPQGHVWHGMDYNDIPADTHGGLTFAQIEPCSHEDGTGYWIGFDCVHCGDARFPVGFEHPTYGPEDGHYWLLSEVQAETERLADQVLASKQKPKES